MWASARAFFALAGVAPLAIDHAPIAPLVAAAARADGRLLRAQLGPDRGRRRPRQRAVADSRSGGSNFRWLWVGYLGAASVAFCLDPAAAAAAASPRRRWCCRCSRCSTSRCVRRSDGSTMRGAISATRSAVSVHGRNARDGDRRQGRRDAQPRAARAGVRGRPGARAERHRRADAEGDRSGGAAARHRQAGGARAHPQQARQADRVRVRADEGARRHRRRHPVAGRVSVSGGADRPRAPRELGRQRLSARPRRRRHSDRRADSVGGRLLRRADLGSAVSPQDVRRRSDRDPARAAGQDVRPRRRRHVRARAIATSRSAARTRRSIARSCSG